MLLRPRGCWPLHQRSNPICRSQAHTAAATTTTTMQQPHAHQHAATDVRKPLCDRRSYQFAQLPNGLRVLAIQDTADAVFAAVCANVQAGYFDDAPLQLAGAAHFLEHMVHLGSEAFPDEREYKAFLAAHGGSSNASTSMVHTRYHFKVHASALGGALCRLGAALSSPLLLEAAAAREVENVHAEMSRNTNSDARKLLQLKRSLCEPPYSGFSTGSIKTLWEEPTAAGVSVPGVLRQLWERTYAAESTTLAVVGPQGTQELLRLVQEAFGGMRPVAGGSSGSIGGGSGAVKRFKAADSAGAEELQQAAVDSRSSDGSISGSSSSSSDSDSEAAPLAAAAGAVAGVPLHATPEAAVVHSKAQQEPLQAGSADAEPCSLIAAPTHHHHQHQQQQQQQQQHTQAQPPPSLPQQQQHRYPVDVVASSVSGGGPQLVRVCPQRELRELEVVWYMPQGAMTHSGVKPWHLASHLLGHEVPGSVAHLLKAQGLVQSLSVGTGDEVRLGRGWMFWGATLQLTQAGEQQVEHVLATLFRGVQVLQSCSDAELQRHWAEVSALAALKFDWRDQAEPLAAAQAAAYALHYYAPEQVLSGPALLTCHDASAIRWFLQRLSPSSSSMRVFWSSRQHKAVAISREQWYGAQYAVEPLPQEWLHSISSYMAVDDKGAAAAGSTQQQEQRQQPEGAGAERCVVAPVPVPGELHLPPPNWAIPSDFTLRQQQDSSTAAGASMPDPAAAAAAADQSSSSIPPACVVQQPGLCAWHQLHTSYGLPKVHLKLHIVTPAVYASPAATVCARVLVRLLDDVLLPTTYPAELAGTTCSLSTGQGGLVLKVTGFQGVAQQLLLAVLTALRDLGPEQVSQRFSTMSGRLRQGLTNWASNNPAQHSEYAAHHLLQQHHHHNRQLLEAAAATQPADVLQLQRQLASGLDMHLDLLAYGNISAAEAAQIAGQVQQLLPAQGLANTAAWPPLGGVFDLSAAAAFAAGSGDAEASAEPQVAAAQGVCGPVCVTYLPANPNPSNSNHAVYYLMQLGPDTVATSVLSDLFVQMSSKAAFHELRTRQRLGYSVHLGGSSMQRQLALVLRVQSPSADPARISGAVTAWLGGWRAELEQLAADKLDSFKQSLLDKYLEPPKSLHEAAHRTWSPISSRTLVFDRRQQKAQALRAVTGQQLLEFYDGHVSPGGTLHHALCVQIWGGAAKEEVAEAKEGAAGGAVVVVAAGDVEAFKQRQRVLPLPQMQLPAGV